MTRRTFLKQLGIGTILAIIFALAPVGGKALITWLLRKPLIAGWVSYRFKYTVAPLPPDRMRLRIRRIAAGEAIA